MSYILPKSMRSTIVRNKIELTKAQENIEKLDIKVATTTDEVSQALNIVYEEYYKLGFTDYSRTGLYWTDHILKENSHLHVIKYQNKVIGTFTVIVRNGEKLPVEENGLKIPEKYINNCAEISLLAIHKKWRGKTGEILFPALVKLYNFCKQVNVEDLYIVFNPKHEIFYEDILLFDILKDYSSKIYCKQVNGAKGVLGHLNLYNALSKYKEIYEKKEQERNLYQFFVLSKYYTQKDIEVGTGKIVLRVINQAISKDLLSRNLYYETAA